MSSASSFDDPIQSDPWERKTVLTLDGGGIRGYSSLLMLRAVMIEIAKIERTEPQALHSADPLPARDRKSIHVTLGRRTVRRKSEEPSKLVYGIPDSSHYFPSHYFDYMAGTSTGGLIAIMLGRLSMTVHECVEAYETLAGEVFGRPRILNRKNFLGPKDKYDGKILESLIEDVVKQREGRSIARFLQANEDMCRTLVTAWQKRQMLNERVVWILRSYHHALLTQNKVSATERNPGGNDDYPIAGVARATSAAPLYFKAVKLDKDNPSFELIDGGFGANNPSYEAYQEVIQMSGYGDKAVGVLISLGTGRDLEDHRHGKGLWLIKSLLNAVTKWATDTQGTHLTTSGLCKKIPATYYRLNVKDGLGKMKLDECKGKMGNKTLKKIREKTTAYLEQEVVQARVHAIAKQLVEIRRARSTHSDRDHWERFCYGVLYQCCVDGCPRVHSIYPDRRALRHHIEDDHPQRQVGDLEALLDDGKRYPYSEPEDEDSSLSQDSYSI